MYKLTRDGLNIIRLADMAGIPVNPHNRDYSAYLEWLTQGNTPQPADPEPPPSQYELDVADARPKLAALMVMTPAQVESWITANVNNLADAKGVLKTLAVGMAILARRL